MTNKQTFKDALQAEHDAGEQVHKAGAALDRALDKLATVHIAYRIARADVGDCCEQCAEALTRTVEEAVDDRDHALDTFIVAQNAHADAINAWGPLYDQLKALNASEPKMISLEMH